MQVDHSQSSRRAALVGGGSLIAATVLFSAVFVYLAQAFDYPQVLDEPAAQVLPRLLALGAEGRAVWLLYGLIPLLLLPTALGVHALARDAAPVSSRAAVLLATLSALTMTAGLLRWPSLHWQLAQAHAHASPAAREAIAAVFDGANGYLGRFVGEFLGELFLNAFFLTSTLALVRSATVPRWLLAAGVAASMLGAVAMLRNATSWVAPVAELNNAVLPLWMLTLGVVLVRQGLRRRVAALPPVPAGRAVSPG